MAIVPLRELDGIGIVRDLPAETLPLNAFTDGKNVRFADGAVEQIDGESAFGGAAPHAPYFAIAAPEVSTFEDSIVHCGLSSVYAYRDGAHTDITRASGPYNAAGNNAWNGTVLGGVLVLNNSVDSPQQWVFPPDTATPLEALTDWSTSWTCKVMRSHLNYLIALDVTKSGTRFPHMIKWSHAAEPGAVPDSWDIADATRDAGEHNLIEGGGFIVDGASLRDQFIIYKEDSIHAMRFIQSNAIFAFYQLFPDYGLLSRNAIGQLYNKHFIVTQSDFIIHDGAIEQSIGDRRIKNWFYQAVGSDGARRTYVTPNYRRKEMWICFSQSGDVVPDTALIWSWQTNAWAVRDLPPAPAIAVGGVAFGVTELTYEDAVEVYADTEDIYYEGQSNLEQQLVMCDPDNSRLLVAGHGKDFAGSHKYSFVERIGLPLGKGTHLHTMKHIKGIWPLMSSRGTKAVTIEVGSQQVPNGPVTWSAPKTFRPWVDRKVDCNLTGVALAYRVSSNNGAGFRLAGLDIDVDEVGTF